MAIGTSYRLSIIALTSGTLHVNTYWMRQRVDTPGVAPSLALVNEWRSIMDNVYRGCFPNNWQQQEYSVFVAKGSPENLTYVNVAQGRGIFGGSPSPTQLSAVITWRTDIAGRRYRGRSYLGSLTSGSFSGQLLAPAYFSALDIFSFRMLNEWQNQSSFDFVIKSKVAGTTSKVTGRDIRNGVFTQRRRTAAYGQ